MERRLTGQDMADLAFGVAAKIHSLGKEPAKICAWCECGLGPNPGAEKVKQANGAIVTHGICPECAKKLEAGK